MYLMPSSMAPMSTSIRAASPTLCPSVRGSPRSFAHRPSPSMTIATCRGTNSAGMAGGRTPLGCGYGGLIRRGCFGSPGTLLKHAPHDATTGSNAPGATAGRRPPGHCTLPGACARSASPRPSRPRTSARISATVCGAGDAAPGSRQFAHTMPPAAIANATSGVCVAGVAAAGALLERGRVAREGERAQQVRVEDQARFAVSGASPRPVRRPSPACIEPVALGVKIIGLVWFEAPRRARAGRRSAAGTGGSRVPSPPASAARRSRASRCRPCTWGSRWPAACRRP